MCVPCGVKHPATSNAVSKVVSYKEPEQWTDDEDFYLWSIRVLNSNRKDLGFLSTNVFLSVFGTVQH